MKVSRAMVAERAGVSPQTVSYYLNGTRSVSKKLTARIDEAISALGYTPDAMATSLVKNESRTIGVILNNIANPLDGEIVKHLEAVALKRGYFINIFSCGDTEMRQYVGSIISRRVDGLYITAIPTKFTEAELDRLLDAGISIVTSVNRIWDKSGVGHIDPDFMQGMDDVAKHLSALGHTRVAYVSAFDERYVFDNRLEAYRAAVRKNGLEEDPRLVAGGDYPYDTDLAAGYRYAKRLIESGARFTALVATNDVMALGAMKALSEAGLKVPQDVSVCGIDDIFLAEGFQPPLTTVGYDKAAFAQRLFDMLYAAVKEHKTEFIEIPMRLVVRESTARRRI